MGGFPFQIGQAGAFVAAMLLASTISLFLSHLSQQNDRRAKQEERRTKAIPDLPVRDHPFLPAILEETKKLPGSRQSCHHVAVALSNLFNDHLETKIRSITQEMARQFDKSLQEKAAQVAALHQRYEEVAAERRQTEAVLRSVAEGVVVVNERGVVVFINPAAEKLLGVKCEEKLGRPLTEGLKDEQLLSRIKKPAQGEEQEIELQSLQDQTRRIIRSSNAVVQDESGQTVGMVSVLTDVTKQRELDRLKSEFASSVTHELRTPIVAVQHSLNLLLDQTAGEISESQKKFLSIAGRNLDRLSIMVDELLDFAKLEAHRVELRLQRNSVQKVVEGACAMLEAWAGSKGIPLEKKVEESLPEINLDSERIIQVLNNLIGNAIKFTPQGGRVTVYARIRKESGEVEIAVEDTGMGIAKEDIPKLFKKFQQVGDGDSSRLKGTGLGLAIAKEIVELHKGRIWMESEKGHGSRCIFTLPMG